MTALVAVVAGVLGLVAGHLVNRAAGRYPWAPTELHDRGVGVAVRPPVVELGTALLFTLAAIRFGLSWELPAFLVLAAVGVLLAVIDLQHHRLPTRVIWPALGIGAGLLAAAALAEPEFAALLRAGLGAVVLGLVFLVLAFISPSGLGMGDVRLATVLGLHLGWLGWDVLLLGGAGGFVVQAVLALVLLATRRVGLRSDLPFGPAMLLGAAVAIGWGPVLPG